jgi:hypothetical protein
MHLTSEDREIAAMIAEGKLLGSPIQTASWADIKPVPVNPDEPSPTEVLLKMREEERW